MIRNVVLIKLQSPATDAARLDEALAAIEALDPPGCVSMRTGRDLALREGGWDGAITADFVDEAAYRAYDAEAERNRIRAELCGAISAQVARVQFEV